MIRCVMCRGKRRIRLKIFFKTSHISTTRTICVDNLSTFSSQLLGFVVEFTTYGVLSFEDVGIQGRRVQGVAFDAIWERGVSRLRNS